MSEKIQKLIEIYKSQIHDLGVAAQTLQQVVNALEETLKEKDDAPQTESN